MRPADRGSANEPDRPRRRRRVPFLGHQLAEYVVAIALVAFGFHLSGGAELALVTAGIILIVLNLVTVGPLGAVALLSRHSHHVGDLVIAAALVLAPFFAYGTLHFWGIVLSEAVAALIVWMERATHYGRATDRRPSGSTVEAVSPPEPGVIDSARIAAGVLAPEAADAARRAAHHAGFVAGVTRRIVRERRANRRDQRG